MKIKQFFIAGVVSAMCLTSPQVFANAEKLSIDKNNIKVWTYQDANNPVFSYKAISTLNAPIEKAMAMVLDVQKTPEWVPNLAKVEVLSQDNQKGDFVLYMVLDFPFPLKDRDVIVKGKISKDANGIVTVRNKAITQGKPVNPDYIRLKNYQGDWSFQAISEHKVKVTTSGYADPEGSIPLSVANMFVQQQPYQMLQKMNVELKKPNKKFAELPAILR